MMAKRNFSTAVVPASRRELDSETWVFSHCSNRRRKERELWIEEALRLAWSRVCSNFWVRGCYELENPH
jgi:hypothetical protein